MYIQLKGADVYEHVYLFITILDRKGIHVRVGTLYSHVDVTFSMHGEISKIGILKISKRDC